MLKKSGLLLGAVLVLGACAMPSMAPAASWSPIGTVGVLDSANLTFSIPLAGISWSCPATRFTTAIHSGAVMTLTGATFTNCRGQSGGINGCTVTPVGTGFPWRATAVTTNDIRIHSVDVDVRFETAPPAGSVACVDNGGSIRVTGTLGTGAAGTTIWDPPPVRFLTFVSTPGLAAHFPPPIGITDPATVTGVVAATGIVNISD